MLPTIPLFPVPFWLAVLRLELLLRLVVLAFRVLLERPFELVLRPLALERVLPLVERAALERPPEVVLRPLALLEPEALLRPPDAGFERDALPEAAAERLRDEAPPELPFAVGFDPAPLDAPRVPCRLLEAGLVAIPSLLLIENVRNCTIGATRPGCPAIGCREFAVAVDLTTFG